MEIRGVIDRVTVYDDFAHHPTAIATTLSGLRARGSGARIIAVARSALEYHETRRASGRIGAGPGVWRTARGSSTRRIWAGICRARLRRWAIGRDLRRASMSWSRDWLPTAVRADHIVVMSNGGFGGLHDKLLAALRARK